MRSATRFWLPVVSAALLIAADPPWKSKQISQWDEEDAKQILTNSPWAKTVMATVLPQLNAAQRSEGGATGGGAGVGLKALDGISLKDLRSLASPQARSVTSTASEIVTVRWESALPVRVAEMKAREIGAPDWQEGAYTIAVYQVPGLNAAQKSLAGELKKVVWLKREGKKDLKPLRVEVFEQASGRAMVVYLFPRLAEVIEKETQIDFVAQIGRLYVAQSFRTEEMRFQGKLEL